MSSGGASLDFSTSGQVLSMAEKAKRAKAKGLCPTCGTVTHDNGSSALKRKKGLTNAQVHEGICIRCQPHNVPQDVFHAYLHEERRKSQHHLQRQQQQQQQDSELDRLKQLRDEAKRKVHLPTSTRQRVLDSWKLVQNDLDSLGMEFFLQTFKRYPQWKELFPFGNCEDAQALEQSKLLKTHAKMVMQTIGQGLSGLSDMETLVPYLRQLGRMHSLIGVQSGDFDKLYPILMACVQRRVGPKHWTKETQAAWQDCFQMIVSIMKDPSQHLQVEPIEGWGLWNFVVCLYLTLVTPLQLAGFPDPSPLCRFTCQVMDGVAIATCLLDWTSELLQQDVAQSKRRSQQLSKIRSTSKQPGAGQISILFPPGTMGHRFFSSSAWFAVRFRLNRILRRLQFARFSPWPRMDALILLSFVLQHCAATFGPLEDSPGWYGYYCAAGLIRLVALARVIHFVKCLELIALKNTWIRLEHFHQVQLARVSALLVFVVHLFACWHCMLVQLPESTVTYGAPALRRAFVAPSSGAGDDSDNHTTNMINAYLRAIHWSVVNVSGVGSGSESGAPETSVEILLSIVVHVVGAVFYAICAGSIFGILESKAQSFGKVGAGVSSLQHFMQRCNIPDPSQDKILSSYLLHNLIAPSEGDSDDQTINNSSSEAQLSSAMATMAGGAELANNAQPLLPDAADGLPLHLNMELTLFSRAKAIRDRGIPTASVEFSFVLAESLLEQVTLLPGDFLFRTGDKLSRRVVFLVDKGVLEVCVDGVTKECLYPGHVIGLGWLGTVPMDSKESLSYKACKDYLSLDGMVAIASIRAMDACRLVLGLSSHKEVADLRRLYPEDMRKIQARCETGGSSGSLGGGSSNTGASAFRRNQSSLIQQQQAVASSDTSSSSSSWSASQQVASCTERSTTSRIGFSER